MIMNWVVSNKAQDFTGYRKFVKENVQVSFNTVQNQQKNTKFNRHENKKTAYKN